MSFGEYEDCFVWTCDGCSQEAIFPIGDFWRSLGELKARGWRVGRDDEGRDHRCSKCRKKETSFLDRKPKVVGGGG